jgi:Na+-transporting methylmalonyl-CoA/oxaloacetate decarboxylase gamma subunit
MSYEVLIEAIKLGVAGVSIIGIVIIVQNFLSYMKKQHQEFLNVITNHIEHSAEALNKLEKTNDRLTFCIQALIDYLKKNDKKRRN